MPATKPPDTPQTLAAALAAFQAEHAGAGKDSRGNYGTYTSLVQALQAIQQATKFGLSHSQTFDYEIHQTLGVITVLKTEIWHVGTNEKIVSTLPLPDFSGGRGNMAQNLGGTITYCRRYAVLAAYGLAGDDDDGEELTPVNQRTTSKPAAKPASKPVPIPNQQPVKTAKVAPRTATPPPKIDVDESKIAETVKAIKPETHADLCSRMGDLAEDVRNEVANQFKALVGIDPAIALGGDHIKTEQHGLVLQNLLDGKN